MVYMPVYVYYNVPIYLHECKYLSISLCVYILCAIYYEYTNLCAVMRVYVGYFKHIYSTVNH